MKKRKKTKTIFTEKEFKDGEADRLKEYLAKHKEGIVYKINITTDFIHRWTTDIREIYVPSEGIFYNAQGCGMIHIGRYDHAKRLGIVLLGEHQVETLRDYIKAKEGLDNLQEHFSTTIKFMDKKKC